MQIYRWPEMPTLPSVGSPVLLRVPVPAARPEARREVRAVLRAVLANWSGVTVDQIQLVESGRGPVWLQQNDSANVDISLSYGAGEAWIGLVRGGRIGVDMMRVEPFAEAPDVARNYLGPIAAAEIEKAPDPACAFAAAWTKHEARLKCAKRDLREWSGEETTVGGIMELAGEDWVGVVAVTGLCGAWRKI